LVLQNSDNMASISDTSYWISFFTSAGIPAGDATHYAILFTDNRISREMLLDVSKEYLTDMGISRLGDIIAILKHCKIVYNQEAKDRILKSTSLTTASLQARSNSPLITPRRSTAASRMVNHFTSKYPEAAPMSQTPVPKLPPPDPPKSKRKVSVFERLGADEEEDVTLPAGSTTTSASVFNRLGGLKRSASSSSLDSTESVLPYAGVLKADSPFSSPSPKKAKNITVAVTQNTRTPSMSQSSLRIKKVITNNIAEAKKSSSAQQRPEVSKQRPELGIQRPEISTTTAGVLSDKAQKETLSLKERLGSKSEVCSSSSIDSAPKSFKVGNSLKSEKNFKMTIQDRLGSKLDDQSSPVVSSTQSPSTSVKSKPEKITAKKSGVFSRLGKKS